MGICLASEAGSRSTNSATPSDTATSTPTVRPFNPSTSPSASASSTPSTTPALRCSAVRTDARTETCTTTSAVSGASTGSDTPVTARAIGHDNPAANADFATVPISVDVGRVHETASVSRCHGRRRRAPTRHSGRFATISATARAPAQLSSYLKDTESFVR